MATQQGTPVFNGVIPQGTTYAIQMQLFSDEAKKIPRPLAGYTGYGAIKQEIDDSAILEAYTVVITDEDLGMLEARLTKPQTDVIFLLGPGVHDVFITDGTNVEKVFKGTQQQEKSTVTAAPP